MSRVISGVCDFLCVSLCGFVCPHSKRKAARAINTKVGRYTAHSSRSACVDPEVKRSKGQGHAVVMKCAAGFACRQDCIDVLVIVEGLQVWRTR